MMRRPPTPPSWDPSPPRPSKTPWPLIIRMVVLLGVLAVVALGFAACASINLNGLLS